MSQEEDQGEDREERWRRKNEESKSETRRTEKNTREPGGREQEKHGEGPFLLLFEGCLHAVCEVWAMLRKVTVTGLTLGTGTADDRETQTDAIDRPPLHIPLDQRTLARAL